MGGKATVWVVKDGRAEPYQVTTGLEGPERIEIARGLVGDERVIARGHDGLYAGARVVDMSGAAPPKPAAADAPTQKTMPGVPEKPASPEAPKDKDMPGMPGMRR